MINNNYVFFWGGIFSNWATSKIVENDIEFSCSEQYMMYKKALLFGDQEIADQVLATKNPRDQKALGRKVKNYNQATWDAHKYDIVKEGCRLKFEQNPVLKHGLLSYKGKEFVEASPEDSIWGIGFKQDDALDNKDKWGENLLGKLLTELSNELSYTDQDIFQLRLIGVKVPQ